MTKMLQSTIIIVSVSCGYLMAFSLSKFECKEGPPKEVNSVACCRTVKTFDDNVLKKCFSQFGKNPPRPGRGMRGSMSGHECVFECILNTTKSLENNKLNVQVLTQKRTASLSSNPEWIPVVTAAVNYCTNQVNQNSVRLRNSLKGEPTNGITICSPTSAFLIGCMYSYEFRNCPSKFWTAVKDAKCNELKQHYNRCPTPFIY